LGHRLAALLGRGRSGPAGHAPGGDAAIRIRVEDRRQCPTLASAQQRVVAHVIVDVIDGDGEGDASPELDEIRTQTTNPGAPESRSAAHPLGQHPISPSAPERQLNGQRYGAGVNRRHVPTVGRDGAEPVIGLVSARAGLAS